MTTVLDFIGNTVCKTGTWERLVLVQLWVIFEERAFPLALKFRILRRAQQISFLEASVWTFPKQRKPLDVMVKPSLPQN